MFKRLCTECGQSPADVCRPCAELMGDEGSPQQAGEEMGVAESPQPSAAVTHENERGVKSMQGLENPRGDVSTLKTPRETGLETRSATSSPASPSAPSAPSGVREAAQRLLDARDVMLNSPGSTNGQWWDVQNAAEALRAALASPAGEKE